MNPIVAAVSGAGVKMLRKYAIVLVLIGLIAAFTAINPTFISVNNLMNILVQNTFLIIASIGMAFVMIGGGIDLSVGYQISLVGVITTILMKWVGLSIPVAILVGVASGTFLGLINGFLSVRLRIHSMIITLATMAAYEGLSYILSNSNSIYDLPAKFKFIGQGYVGPVPFSVILCIFVAALATIILDQTYYGRFVYAIGGNEEAARLAGINVSMMKLTVFALCGFFVAVSTVVLVSRSGSTNSSVGAGTEFTCITAAILGGVSFKGGEGKIWGVVVGTLILGVLATGMQIIGMGIYPQYIAKCLVLLTAVTLDSYQKSAGSAKLAKLAG